MNEKQFNAKLIEHARHMRVISFEACGLPSVPDLFCQVRPGVNFWLEGKIKANENSSIPFRPGQKEWARALMLRGGFYFVWCWLPKIKFIQFYRTRINNGGITYHNAGVINANAINWPMAIGLAEDRFLRLLRPRCPWARL